MVERHDLDRFYAHGAADGDREQERGLVAADADRQQFGADLHAVRVLVEPGDRMPSDVHLASADGVLQRGVLGVQRGDIVGGAGDDGVEVTLNQGFGVDGHVPQVTR